MHHRISISISQIICMSLWTNIKITSWDEKQERNLMQSKYYLKFRISNNDISKNVSFFKLTERKGDLSLSIKNIYSYQ